MKTGKYRKIKTGKYRKYQTGKIRSNIWIYSWSTYACAFRCCASAPIIIVVRMRTLACCAHGLCLGRDFVDARLERRKILTGKIPHLTAVVCISTIMGLYIYCCNGTVISYSSSGVLEPLHLRCWGSAPIFVWIATLARWCLLWALTLPPTGSLVDTCKLERKYPNG